VGQMLRCPVLAALNSKDAENNLTHVFVLLCGVAP
jgi:hypothetical protein